YTPFTSAHLINFEWLQHDAGMNQIFPTSTDLIDAAARTVITAYAVHRPDDNWSLMLINHDLNAAHPIHLDISDANKKSHTFTGQIALVQYCNSTNANVNTTISPSLDGNYNLPAG